MAGEMKGITHPYLDGEGGHLQYNPFRFKLVAAGEVFGKGLGFDRLRRVGEKTGTPYFFSQEAVSV